LGFFSVLSGLVADTRGCCACLQEELVKLVERHKFHITKLETLTRLLDNDHVDAEGIREKIMEEMNYYIDSNHEATFVENEFMYEDFDEVMNMAEEHLIGRGGDSDTSDDDDDDTNKGDHTASAAPATSATAAVTPTPVSATVSATATAATSTASVNAAAAAAAAASASASAAAAAAAAANKNKRGGTTPAVPAPAVDATKKAGPAITATPPVAAGKGATPAAQSAMPAAAAAAVVAAGGKTGAGAATPVTLTAAAAVAKGKDAGLSAAAVAAKNTPAATAAATVSSPGPSAGRPAINFAQAAAPPPKQTAALTATTTAAATTAHAPAAPTSGVPPVTGETAKALDAAAKLLTQQPAQPKVARARHVAVNRRDVMPFFVAGCVDGTGTNSKHASDDSGGCTECRHDHNTSRYTCARGAVATAAHVNGTVAAALASQCPQLARSCRSRPPASRR
jgi:CCR4-NOT transcription complex subunit 3